MSEYCITNTEEVKPYREKPDNIIKGGPPIRTFHVLNDKRHILTKDTDNNVCLYDVLKVATVRKCLVTCISRFC